MLILLFRDVAQFEGFVALFQNLWLLMLNQVLIEHHLLILLHILLQLMMSEFLVDEMRLRVWGLLVVVLVSMGGKCCGWPCC